MVKKYTPNRGDIVVFDFNPTKGHEQNGYRLALIISNYTFNKNTKMAIACPITSNDKEFPTHYILQNCQKVKGAVLCEHIRSIDYEIRNLKFIEKLSNNDFISIITLLNACIEE